MPYKLTLNEQPGEAPEKDVGDNVFLNNLPLEYEVYLFFYPDMTGNSDLKDVLRELGEMTGPNLFVNLGKLNDPNYKRIASYFEIKSLPCIVITAIDSLASQPTLFLSTFVRIDSKRLLNDREHLVECLGKIFNLYITGQIADALKEAKKDDRDSLVRSFTKVIVEGLKGLWDFIRETDISFSLAEGKFELKRH